MVYISICDRYIYWHNGVSHLIGDHDLADGTVHRNLSPPYRDIYMNRCIATIHCHDNLLLSVESGIAYEVTTALQEHKCSCLNGLIGLVEEDHIPVEVDQIIICMSPRVGTATVWISESTHTSLVSIV